MASQKKPYRGISKKIISLQVPIMPHFFIGEARASYSWGTSVMIKYGLNFTDYVLKLTLYVITYHLFIIHYLTFNLNKLRGLQPRCNIME